MKEITINENISYIEASRDPLSADIGIIRTENAVWLFDVGNGDESILSLDGEYRVVLSHFHADHAGNIEKIRKSALFVSKETYCHVKTGNIVGSDLCVDGVHIFPIPSSHAKGCLGLEVGSFAFVGDALYGMEKNRKYVYNAQKLKEEINVLKALKAEKLLVSHFDGMVREKSDVISELETIYRKRISYSPFIEVNEE